MSALWTEHRNAEGRTYWFNTTTKESVWEKPDDLKSDFEKALAETPWKEYFSGGRKYYYNTETKESKWSLPDELIPLMEAHGGKDAAANPNAPGAASQGALVLASDSSLASFLPQPEPGALLPAHPGMLAGALVPLGIGATAAGALPTRPHLPEDPVIPFNGFATHDEAERAFVHLLRKAGVDAGWTWDQTMRTIITDPLYKALTTLAERKAAWQKYVDNLRTKEAEEKDARLAKLRPALRNLLKGNPNIFPYTTFPTADRLFKTHPIWQQGKIEAERKLVFEEYVAELKDREITQQRAAHARALTKVVALFKDLGVDVLTRWRDAQRQLVESDAWRSDPELDALPSLDVLLAFEDFARVQEREFEEQMRRAQVDKTRRERKAREGFKELLHELVDRGALRARSKWKQVYPELAHDARYTALLGVPGSNPLELFWDVVDGLDQALDRKIAVVSAAIAAAAPAAPAAPASGSEEGEAQRGFAVGPETTLDDLMKVVKNDPEVKKMSEKDLELVYMTMHDDALKKKDEEKRRHERRQRHLQDDLRYALKKVSEVTANSTYEEAVPAMEHLSEYKALDDEGRRSAFSKFVKRQKERLREASEDGGSASGRRRKEPARDDRDRSRERERDTRDRRDSHRDHADSSHRERDRRGSDRRGSERRESRGDWERDAPPAPRRSDSKRDLPPHEKMDERADKRPKFEREDTPEEGEI